MRQGLEILGNLLFWLSSAGLIISGFSIEAQEIEILDGVETFRVIRNQGIMLQLLLCIILSVIPFYFNLHIWRRLEERNTWRKGLFFSLLGLLLCYLVYLLVERWRLPIFEGRISSTLSIGIFLFYYAISLAYSFTKLLWKREHLHQSVLLEKKQAELQLLRNQLQPHFLFNVLNNLLALVDQQRNPQLGKAIDRLSELLRYVIHGNQLEKVPLDQELAFLRNYADLQLLRFEPEEVNFTLEVKGDAKDQLIEPGLFLPFLENAFKYGAEPENKASIQVHFDLTRPGRIIYEISNAVFKALYQGEMGTGMGIAATRDRLELIYPGTYQLDIREGEEFYVKLQIDTNAGHHH